MTKVSSKIDQRKLPALAKMMRKGVKPEVARKRLNIPKSQFNAYIQVYVKKARQLLVWDIKDKSVLVHPNWRSKLLGVMGIRQGVVGALKFVKFGNKTPMQHAALHMAGFPLRKVGRGVVGLRSGAYIYVAPNSLKPFNEARARAAKIKAKKIFARRKGRYAFGLPKMRSNRRLKPQERKILAEAGYARLRIHKNNKGLPPGVYWITPRGARSLGIKNTKTVYNFSFEKSNIG